MSTVHELEKISQQVLAWVARERRMNDEFPVVTEDEIRRIELCALAVQEQVLLRKWLSP